MNIVLFLNKDVESAIAYNVLKPTLLKHNTRVFFSEGVGKQNSASKTLRRLTYFEKEWFFEVLPNWLESKSITTDFSFINEKDLAFPCQRCTSVKSSSFFEEVRAFEPDLFLSIRFGKIFKGPILELPKLGILNLHSAVLPNYRGILGTLHSLKDGLKEIGCTLHYITDDQIDVGPIIDIAYLNSNRERSLIWHLVHLYPKGCAMIIAAIEKLEKEELLPFNEQDLNVGNYYSLPEEIHFEKLRTNGYKVVAKWDYLEILQDWISPQISEDVFNASTQ